MPSTDLTATPMHYNELSTVWITTEFIALHRFPGAAQAFPARHYLEHPHRHKFFVRAEIEVHHDERDIEYHEMKDLLDAHIGLWVAGGTFAMEQSCESIARKLLTWLRQAYPNRRFYSMSVAEDNENGSVIRLTT